MSSASARVAYITAGAAGMFCGSCMHDNTLARSLSRLGVDVQLIPTYTPIRTDDENVSVDRVFYGGISVYLEHRFPWYRRVSALFSPLVDQNWLIRWATRRAGSTDPRLLGSLTVSMLQGAHGHQKAEAEKLCRWLAEVDPQLLLFSNILIAGCIPRLKQVLDGKVFVVLQGDDVFLDQLPQPFRGQAFAEIRQLVDSVDGFLVHSQFYGDFMAGYLGIPRDRIHQIPLGIDLAGFETKSKTSRQETPLTIGYLARLAPEKGLHLLVDAYLELRRQPDFGDLKLAIAGWLGEQHRPYAEAQFEKLKAAGFEADYQFAGSISREEKIEFLRGIDVLSVPTVQQEPKGLFVLEALAAGVPVVQPEHGAFPELLDATGGGRLVPALDAEQLAAGIADLLRDHEARFELASVGQRTVHEAFAAEAAARRTWEKLESLTR